MRKEKIKIIGGETERSLMELVKSYENLGWYMKSEKPIYEEVVGRYLCVMAKKD